MLKRYKHPSVKCTLSINIAEIIKLNKISEHTECVLTELLTVEKDFNETLDAEGLDMWN